MQSTKTQKSFTNTGEFYIQQIRGLSSDHPVQGLTSPCAQKRQKQMASVPHTYFISKITYT